MKVEQIFKCHHVKPHLHTHTHTLYELKPSSYDLHSWSKMTSSNHKVALMLINQAIVSIFFIGFFWFLSLSLGNGYDVPAWLILCPIALFFLWVIVFLLLLLELEEILRIYYDFSLVNWVRSWVCECVKKIWEWKY